MILHHGDRVRIGGFAGRRGVVMRCERRDRSGVYFRVRLENGAWVSTDGAVVDSIGIYELTCSECEGRFRANRLPEVLCPNCDRRGEYRPGSTSFGAHRQLLRGTATTPREKVDDDREF